MFSWVNARRRYRTRRTHDVADIQLSVYNVCPVARCIIVHKNKTYPKLFHPGIMRSLMTSSKNLWTFTVGILKTCMSELSSAQTIPTVSVMFYNITPSKSLSGSTPIDSHLCIKTKYGFVTENNMASLIYTTSAMLPCPVQANLRLTVIQRDPNCQYFFKESQLT